MSDLRKETAHAAMVAIGKRARHSAAEMGRATTEAKNLALRILAETLRSEIEGIISANEADVAAARANGLTEVMIDRLQIGRAGVDQMAIGVEQIVRLDDPVGTIEGLATMPSGIEVGRMRVALGVVGIIFESRPNVTIDAAALCIKSGNAAILRGGSEALRCNVFLAGLVSSSLVAAGLPADGVQLVGSTDRAFVGEMISMPEYIDVIIPRGGKELIARLATESKIPMIKHLDGICHVYIDESAEPKMALAITDNAKTNRYGTCNTMETLLMHRACAATLLPEIAAALQAKGVELRGDERARAIVPSLLPACEADWSTEYLAPILSIGIAEDLRGAIDHINRYGSHHTDAIVTGDRAAALQFLREVDSASVMINASTRFADGFEFGLGAEIGISNDKLHARGPVGLEGLTSQKYIVFGHGEVRQ